MGTTTLDERNSVLERLVVAAWSDKAFRNELAEQPRAAFERATGLRVPATVELRVCFDTPTLVHVPLPMQEDPGFAWERVGPGFPLPKEDASTPQTFLGGFRQPTPLYDRIAREFWRRAELKDQLEQHPHETLARLLRVSPAADIAYRPVTDSPTTRYVVVGYRIDMDGLEAGPESDHELSHDELEMVAGGGGVFGPTEGPKYG